MLQFIDHESSTFSEACGFPETTQKQVTDEILDFVKSLYDSDLEVKNKRFNKSELFEVLFPVVKNKLIQIDRDNDNIDGYATCLTYTMSFNDAFGALFVGESISLHKRKELLKILEQQL
jgi:hypothetical protein